MKKLIVLVQAFYVLGSLSHLKAQSLLTLTFPQTYVAFSPSAATDSTVTGRFALTLTDTSQIGFIEFKIGSYADTSDIVESVIPFDDPNSLPANFTYNRIGNLLTVEIENLPQADTYFTEIRLKDLNGAWTDPVKVINN